MNEEVKTPTTEEIKDDVVVDETIEEEELSPWYYFFSVGCGFCKKVEPIVDELNESGKYPEILKLDMSEPDNQKLNQELSQEYKKQCGTPWFINADTGEAICGFREKDILEKWLKGEEIPEPPRVKGQMPKIPFHGSSDKENKKWKKEYNAWLKDNEHMGEDFTKRQRPADEIIESPRPKSDPPRPPMGPSLATTSDEDIDKWGEEMKVWQEENNHLPNLQDVDRMVGMIKQRKAGGNQPGNAPNPQINTLVAKVQALEVKMNKLMEHFGVK